MVMMHSGIKNEGNPDTLLNKTTYVKNIYGLEDIMLSELSLSTEPNGRILFTIRL